MLLFFPPLYLISYEIYQTCENELRMSRLSAHVAPAVWNSLPLDIIFESVNIGRSYLHIRKFFPVLQLSSV